MTITMKMMTLACAVLFAVAGAALTNAGDTTDTDMDGVPDGWDNCVDVPNPTQDDPDLDGYGVACDCDFNNTGSCDGLDFSLFAGLFGSAVPPGNPNMDMNSSGSIDGLDFSIFAGVFGGMPGPSGLPCAGTIPCAESF